MTKHGPLFILSAACASVAMLALGMGMAKTPSYSPDALTSNAITGHRFLPAPPAIKNSVQFWKSVYTNYDSDQRILYHRAHPEVIYGVIDLRPLRKESRSAFEFERKARVHLLTQLNLYRKAFDVLARGQTNDLGKDLFEVTQKIISAQGKLVHEHSYKDQRRALRIQTGQRDQVLLAIKRAKPFMAEIQKIFEKNHLPKELIYLSFVESSFNVKAESRSGAVGIWQFLENTGKKFLKINGGGGDDERKDPIRSSAAAALLLKQNYQYLSQAWPLAITAYHHGYTALIRIPKAHRKSERIFEYFQLCQPIGKIGWTSRNYYSEFLAMIESVKELESLKTDWATNEKDLEQRSLRL